eukprot:535351_1
MVLGTMEMEWPFVLMINLINWILLVVILHVLVLVRIYFIHVFFFENLDDIQWTETNFIDNVFSNNNGLPIGEDKFEKVSLSIFQNMQNSVFQHNKFKQEDLTITDLDMMERFLLTRITP